MGQTIIRTVVDVAEIILLIYMIVRSLQMEKPRSLFVSIIYFVMGAMALTLDLMYWMLFVATTPPEVRLPFSADVIAENAAFLLFAASIKSMFNGKLKLLTKETAATAVFIACNTALWYGWSGELLQDLVGGVIFGYLLCVALNAARQRGILKSRVVKVTVPLAVIIVIIEALPFFIPGITVIADAIAYTLIIASCVIYVFMTARMVKGNASGIDSFPVSALCSVWCFTCMYMCSEPVYFIPDILSVISLQMMMLSLRKAVKEV